MYINDWNQIREFGIMQGFDNVVVWLVVLLIGVGGLLVAATMKYADNIVKCFATAIAIVLDIVLSIPIFHFIPSWSFVVGAPLVIFATILYSMAPKNVCGLDNVDLPDPCPCFGDRAKPAATKPTETNKLINK